MVLDRSLLGCHKTEMDTPALLLDMEVAERNIEAMAAFFADKSCKLRPHTKTHKLPLLAHKQMEAGAIGVTCAKLEEASVFADSGIPSVLIANQIVGLAKMRRLLELLDRIGIIVCVDSIENAEALSLAAGMEGKQIPFLVEVDVGLHRCGVPPLERTVELIQHCFRAA